MNTYLKKVKDRDWNGNKALAKTLFHFFFGLGCAVAKKMKVCFVRWHRNSNYFFCAVGVF